ncbi:sporulation protein [Hymenobacter sp. 5317J-9]|uniref:sporulation protein n=1 Tax=Hymenobacter sp. 5317J-9 TaxID=2932250 RepID=UPI001FD6EEE2|nr:sporulation protein [Hymenobacter sp. 5317J-9]UOQ98877.1 sporulation protein [Hymenobacter sp. 5317J-9]
MIRPLLKALLLPSLLSLVACASTAQQAPQTSASPDTTRKPTAPTASASMPAEDVSKYRPVFAVPKPAPVAATPAPKTVVPPTGHVNPQVEQRLRDQAYTNQNVKYAQGYRILVYLGLERDQVMAIRRSIISRYPDETDYIVFKSPVYRLYIGDYLTKLDAARGVARLRGLAPKLELEPTQVLLNKNP